MPTIENDFFRQLDFSFDSKQLAGAKVLISEPFLGDPNFNRSVILLINYEPEEGAFGIILNRKSDLELSDVINDFETPGFSFYHGGPVGTDTLFFLHRCGVLIPDSKEIMPGLWWGGDFEVLKTQIMLGTVQPEDVMFFGGYSGWAPEQLEREVKERSWIIGSLSTDEIFQIESNALWKKSLRSMGRKFSIMADFPEDPGLN